MSYGADRKRQTVRYLELTAMLLNELQKQVRQNQRQAEQIKRLSAQMERLEGMFEQAMTAQSSSRRLVAAAAINR